jgi:hypothetical protein
METKTIYQKIAEIKKEIGTIKKDKTNKFFNNAPYFDINQLIEAVEPLLEKQSLILLQPIINGNVITMIIDIETKEKIESELKLPEELNPQKIGSAITYYRRYTLQSLLSLQAEDDDGNKASEPKKEYNAQPKINEWLSEAQYNSFLKRLNEAELPFDLEDIAKELKEWSIAPKGMKKEWRENLQNIYKQKSI